MRVIPLLLLGLCVNARAELSPALAPLLAVGLEGKGNPEAAAAWKKAVADATPARLPEFLDAMNAAGPLAQNWLRSAVDAIADREKAAGRVISADILTAYLKDPARGGPARLLAAELLRRSDTAAWDSLAPGLLTDPVAALRREPVAALLKTAESAKDKSALRQALDAARDEDQVLAAAEALRGLGETVDLPLHFGFLMDWRVIGPFENKDRKGFNTVFPPETVIDNAAAYPGKEVKAGEPSVVKWQPFTSGNEFGLVDFNKPVGMIKESTAYAVTTFHSAEERDAEIRLGCKNAWKVWLNGRELFGRDEYHRGMRIDQYRLPAKLTKGANEILVKCCQNEQQETWTVEWEFQLRVCDASGTPILDTARPPTPDTALRGKEKSAR